MVDIWIAIGLCALTAAMAYMGIHVTLHPPESPRAKLFWKLGFVLVAFVACGLIAVQTKRNADVLEAIKKNTEKPPQVTVNVPPAAPPSVIISQPLPTDNSKNRDASGDVLGRVDAIPTEIKAGTQLALNLMLLSRSSVPVDGVIRYFSIATALIPNSDNWETEEDAQVDRRVFRDFHKAAIAQARSTKPNERISIEPSRGVYNTLAVTFPNQEAVDNFMRGKARIYTYVWARWPDAKRDLEECQWMQPPSTPVIQNDRVVWHACAH